MNKTHLLGLRFTIMVAALSAPLAYLSAQQTDRVQTSDSIKPLFSCIDIASDEERLACYDREVRAFSAAKGKGEIIIAERKDVETARREIFGLSVSDNPIFGDSNDEGVKSITAVVTSVSQLRDGRWVMTLDTGARWVQTEARRTRRGPKKGQTLEISRGSFGAFKAQPEGGKSFKVKRLR